MRRLFYQIYCDGYLFEIFDEATVSDDKKIYAVIFNYLGRLGIRSFSEDVRQYIVILEDGTEVKIANTMRFGKKWIQVSSTEFERAKEVFDGLINAVKDAFEEGDA